MPSYPFRGWTGLSEATATRFKASTDCSTCPPCSNRQTGQRVSVREIRYRKQASTVRNVRAVLKKASSGTRRIFRSIRCKKQAFLVREGYSVPETAFWCTERIFKGALNSLMLHRMHFRKRKNGILSHRTHLKRTAEQPTPQTVDSLLPHRTHFQRRAVPKAASCRSGRNFSARNGFRSLCSLRPLPPFPSSR